MKINFLYAFVFLILAHGLYTDNEIKCKREIVESYNLNGYLSPRTANMYLCPNIKTTCCSIYDQFMMFSTWKERIKPKLLKYFDSIRNKYKILKD